MQSNKPKMDTMLPWIPFCSKRKRHFINSPYNMLRSHTSNPTFILVHSWSTIMKPSLSLVLQTPLMNVWITLKHLIQTQWKGFHEVKAGFDIGNLHHLHTHCDGEDGDATETPRLCIWRQDLISVIHIEWRLMYDKSFGYLSHDIYHTISGGRARSEEPRLRIRWRCLAFNHWANMIVLWERIQIADGTDVH